MSESMLYYAPLILIVVGNVLYNVVGKAVPDEANPFATLIITYLVSLIASTVLFFAVSPHASLLSALSGLNWASFALGITIVLIDVSVIMVYRVGWDISVGTLVGNIGVSVLSVIAGIVFWSESLTFVMIIGIVFCLAGVTATSISEERKHTEAGTGRMGLYGLRNRIRFYSPILIMLVARFVYMLVQKVTPLEIDPFASVMVAYASCLFCTGVALVFSVRGKGIGASFKKVNWTAAAFGACLVLLDVSTLWLFRAGWDLSLGTLLMYVLQAIALVAIGCAFYRERITLARGAGVAACIIGIILVML